MVMKCHVIEDIDNRFLKSEWRRLEREADAFPQNTYDWCATWWRHLGSHRELHVVMVLDEDGQARGIVPLCIERHCGIRVLRSFPINYGDFFQIIVSPEAEEEDVFELALSYMAQCRRWRCVLLAPINDHSTLHAFLCRKGCESKLLVGNVVADIRADSWDEYLGRVSRNRRRLTHKKMRALEGQYDVEVDVVGDRKGYVQWFDRIREMVDARGMRDRPKRSNAYMECVRETNSHLFSTGQMVLHLVKASGTVIAYRIGIVQGRTYYDWNTSYDTAWAQYSPGMLSVAYVIRSLIAEGFSTLDFMAGVYDYKLSYSPKHEMRSNHLFVMGDGSIQSALIRKYQLAWRDQVRPYYHRFVRPVLNRRIPIRLRRSS